MIDSISSRSIVSSRRPSEQPTLWILLLAGSVLLHVGLLLLLRPFWMEQAASGQSGEGAISIDLVDTQPEIKQTSPSSLSPPPVSAKAEAIAALPTSPAPPPDDQAIQAPPRSAPSTVEPSPKPDLQPSPLPRSTSPPPNPSPKPNLQPSLPSSPQPVDRPTETTSKASAPQQISKKTSPPNSRSPRESSSPPLPPRNRTNTSSKDESTSIPTIPLPSQGESGAGLQMTIVGQPREVNRGRDITDEKAQLISPAVLQFPQEAILPCIRRNIGQTVTLLLVIDRRTGKPNQTSLSKGSACDVIAKLVRENVQFNPARQANGQAESQVEIDLQLTPL